MSFSDALLSRSWRMSRHGHDLKRIYDHRFTGPRPLAYGQVYAALTRLQRDKLVEVVEVVEVAQEAGPERTVYAINEAGRAVLKEMAGEGRAPGPVSG